MKITEKRLCWVKGLVREADYLQLGKWGRDSVDVLGDMEDLIDEVEHRRSLDKQ